MTKFFISPPFGNYLDLKECISVKGSFTLEPKNHSLVIKIITTLRYDFFKNGWVNKIGLVNPGIDYAIKKYINNKNCIISVAILEKNEVAKLEKKIPKNMNLELNISCPNVDKLNCEWNLKCDNLKLFLNEERKWTIVKISPFSDMSLIDYYSNQGFRQFHCSNTVPIFKYGGLSGPKVKEFNEHLIPQIRKKYKDIEIIAGGGIRDKDDIYKYQSLGANHFSFSTVIFNPYKFYNLYFNLEHIKYIV